MTNSKNKLFSALMLLVVLGCSSAQQHQPTLSSSAVFQQTLQTQVPNFEREHVYENFPMPAPIVIPSQTIAVAATQRMTALNQNDPAPYSGVLLNGASVARIETQLNTVQQMCMVERVADMERVGARAILDIERIRSSMAESIETNRAIISEQRSENTRLRDQLAHATGIIPSWAWGLIGGVGGVGLFSTLYLLLH
jgi:hypothetical protein